MPPTTVLPTTVPATTAAATTLDPPGGAPNRPAATVNLAFTTKTGWSYTAAIPTFNGAEIVAERNFRTSPPGKSRLEWALRLPAFVDIKAVNATPGREAPPMGFGVAVVGLIDESFFTQEVKSGVAQYNLSLTVNGKDMSCGLASPRIGTTRLSLSGYHCDGHVTSAKFVEKQEYVDEKVNAVIDAIASGGGTAVVYSNGICEVVIMPNRSVEVIGDACQRV